MKWDLIINCEMECTEKLHSIDWRRIIIKYKSRFMRPDGTGDKLNPLILKGRNKNDSGQKYETKHHHKTRRESLTTATTNLDKSHLLLPHLYHI